MRGSFNFNICPILLQCDNSKFLVRFYKEYKRCKLKVSLFIATEQVHFLRWSFLLLFFSPLLPPAFVKNGTEIDSGERLEDLHPRWMAPKSVLLPVSDPPPPSLRDVDDSAPVFRGSAMTRRGAFSAISYMSCAGSRLFHHLFSCSILDSCAMYYAIFYFRYTEEVLYTWCSALLQ